MTIKSYSFRWMTASLKIKDIIFHGNTSCFNYKYSFYLMQRILQRMTWYFLSSCQLICETQPIQSIKKVYITLLIKLSFFVTPNVLGIATKTWILINVVWDKFCYLSPIDGVVMLIFCNLDIFIAHMYILNINVYLTYIS